jgi:Holliday junction DNA helicase RuvA
MFYYLNGRVALIRPYMAVIDCGGVGYACHTTLKTLAALNQGDNAKLFTYCNVREDAFDIYGFVSEAELECFKLLIGITGVGPKAALSILSSSSPEDLAASVVSGNEKALTVAPGIGKKLAQRIMLELRDKMGESLVEGVVYPAVPSSASPDSQKVRDVNAALTVLGYTPGEISAAMKTIETDKLTAEEIIKEILKRSLK